MSRYVTLTFCSQHINWNELKWSDPTRTSRPTLDGATRRVHWSRASAVTTRLAAAKLGRLVLGEFWTYVFQRAVHTGVRELQLSSVQFMCCECELTLTPIRGRYPRRWGRYPGRGQMSGHVGQLLEDHPAARWPLDRVHGLTTKPDPTVPLCYSGGPLFWRSSP